MSDVRVVAHGPDGVEDVTESVKVLYDAVIGSMDWGSNFLTVDEAYAIVTVAEKCGIVAPDEAAKQLAAYVRGHHTECPLRAEGHPMTDRRYRPPVPDRYLIPEDWKDQRVLECPAGHRFRIVFDGSMHSLVRIEDKS